MTPTVAALIFLNVAVHLLVPAYSPLYRDMALVPGVVLARPWTAVTYMFLHAPGLSHLFFNMLSLFFFGPALELRLGNRRFLALYLVSGLMGAVLSAVLPGARWVPTVGASGAVYGVMLGFARFWPRQPVYLWGILGIEARVLIGLMTLISLWSGFGGARDNVAHFAHLGGFAGGWLSLKIFERMSPAAAWKRKVAPPVRPSGAADVERWRRIDPANLHPVNREYLDQVMAKIAAAGAGALTAGEREFLDRFSPR